MQFNCLVINDADLNMFSFQCEKLTKLKRDKYYDTSR